MSGLVLCLFLADGLVVHADEGALRVELQVDVVRQLDVVTVALLVNLGDDGALEVAADILLDGLGNDGSGNNPMVGATVAIAVAIDLALNKK